MKIHPTTPFTSGRPRLVRLGVALLLGMLSLTLAGCDGSDSWLPFGREKSTDEEAIKVLEARFDELKASVTGTQNQVGRVAFWQATAAIFVVLSGIALVGGAALGSRARRDRERFHRHHNQAGLLTPDDLDA